MITDSNGCTALSALYNFVFSNVAEFPDYGFNVYPNPFHEALVISFTEIPKPAELIITDLTCREIIRMKVTGNRNVIETGFLAPGVYTLRIEYESKVVYRKVMKK
jgi:hypothetical protein